MGGPDARPALRGTRAEVVRAGLLEVCRTELARGRWRRLLPGIVLTSADEPTARQWQMGAVLHAGPGAHLAGESALVAHGLQLWTTSRIDVAAPRGVNPIPWARFHRVPAERPTVDLDLPRAAPRDAALQAASWAPTDAAAETVLRMVLQQKLTMPASVRAAVLASTRRRALVLQVLDDLAAGATTTAEAAVRRAWSHRAGLPPLRFQVPFTDPAGTVRRLDVACLPADFPGLRVTISFEIDGVHHLGADVAKDDNQRTVSAALQGIVVLRRANADVLTDPDDVVDTLLALCSAWGWQG